MTTLTQPEFSKYLNSTFCLSDIEPRLELVLVEVSPLRRPAGQETFSLLFRGPKDQFLPQGTNLFRHDQMGEFEMFSTPIKEDANYYYYEAIFNRIAES
jgi:uncharacterized protein DUF6916